MKNIIPDFPLLTRHNFDTVKARLTGEAPNSILDFFNNGVVMLVDKPSGWTSFDVVNKLRNITKAKKVGHCGTLDPFATGLLIVCTGKATKRVDDFSGLEKIYLCEFELGKTTDTMDCDGVIVSEAIVGDYSLESLSSVADEFKGEIDQIPPAFSAIKINGVAAYKLARKGRLPELKSRRIHIFTFDAIAYDQPILKVRIHCSKGTYVRALARDFGIKLGCGAFVKSLQRESIGSFSLSDALTIDQIKESIHLLRTADASSN